MVSPEQESARHARDQDRPRAGLSTDAEGAERDPGGGGGQRRLGEFHSSAGARGGGVVLGIGRLMTRPSHRGQGVARALMGAAERAAVEHGRTLLTLDTAVEGGASTLYAGL